MVEDIGHPDSGVVIRGTIILPGSTLHKGDVYASSDGSWQTYDHMAGKEVAANRNLIWVRPERKRSVWMILIGCGFGVFAGLCTPFEPRYALPIAFGIIGAVCGYFSNPEHSAPTQSAKPHV